MINVQAAALRKVTVDVSTSVIVPFLVLLTVLAIGVTALDVPATSFRSPDEYAGYLFTKTFAETGKLSYDADYLEGDSENLLHPRGVITHDGKAVPFNYLGLPVIYAPFYKVLGDNTRYISIGFALVAVVAMASAGSIVAPRRAWVAWIATLGATPIIYYLNRPFLNSLPALTFLAVGVYFLLDYCRSEATGRWWRLCASSFAFAVAAFSRYEFVVFNTLVVALVLSYHHRSDLWHAVRLFATYAGVTALAFVLPVMLLNYQTYGSPFRFGYGLFNETYFPDRAPGADFPWSLGRLARAIFLPSYPVDLRLAFNALTRQVLGVAPIFSAVAAFGLFSIVRNKAVPTGWLVAGLLLALYTFLYRGAGYSWLADAPDANLEASVVRYALPLYLGFFLVACYGLGRVEQAPVAALLVATLAFLGVTGVMHVDGSLAHVRTQVRAGDEVQRRDVLPNVETNAIVYTDIFDKTVGPYRTVAAWWGGVRGTHEGFFRPRAVARSMARVHEDYPVYLYVYEEDYVVPRLREQLRDWGLTLRAMSVDRLYRLEPLSSSAGASTTVSP